MQEGTVPLLFTTPELKKRRRRSTFLWSYRVGGAQSGRGKIPARVSEVIGFFLPEDKTTPSERCTCSFFKEQKKDTSLFFEQFRCTTNVQPTSSSLLEGFALKTV